MPFVTKTSIDLLLDSYPRTRPPLSMAHQVAYDREYKLNRSGGGLAERAAQKLESWMHRRVARKHGGPILELGAGTLNHMPYESEKAAYDIAEPYTSLYASSVHLARVRNVFGALHDVPPDHRYHRVISIATLEHMTDIPAELARAGLLLDANGLFQAGIPSEGGLLWKMSWRCTTGISYYLRNRLHYADVMRHEHVNTAPEILALVRYFFRECRAARFPTPLHHASFYTYLEARDPDTERCAQFLRRRGEPVGAQSP